MVAQFRQRAEPGEVSCDVCSEPKLKALKSCVVCVASYCQTHLDPHRRAAPLQTHQLIEPVLDLRARSCPRHNKPLELFCENDQTLVCMICSVLQHKNHKLIPFKEGCEAKQEELQKIKSETQGKIQERRQKIREIQQSLDLSQRAAEEEAAEGVQFFSALIDFVQKSYNELIQEMEEKHTKAKKQAEDLIQALEQEISELNQRSTEVEQLTCSKDHLHVLKTFTSLTPAPNKDWTNVKFLPPLFLGTVHKAVSKVKKKLLTMQPKPLSKSQLKEVQQFAADVTLDPDTAHPELGLSEDHKQVWYSGPRLLKTVADNPQRITAYHAVLGTQGFSSGRVYFEVQIKGNTDWVVGVAKESMERKDCVYASPDHAFWAVWRVEEKLYATFDSTLMYLALKSVVEKVGVFVDYEDGVVCFYNMATRELIYCFTGCRFTEKLYPYFNTGTAKAKKLIITAVRAEK